MTTSHCRRFAASSALCALAAWSPVHAQSLSQRGFVDVRGTWFPQQAANDPTRAVADLVVQEEAFAKPASWFQCAAGVDLRANSHEQVEDDWRLDGGDRGTRRPRLSVRRLSATLTRGGFTLDLGKQFVRWGKADIINPTDRFAPRDFLNVLDSEFLAVTGARASVTAGGDTFEAVWAPRLTPSRIPLLTQRWSTTPPELAIPIADGGAAFPRGSQTGLRWSHVGTGFETAASFYKGFNHLPNISLRASTRPAQVQLVRTYPSIRMYGVDAAVPTPWMTIKGEAAYFTSSSPDTDEYVLYVVQLERQTGEWVLVGGYAGERVTNRRALQTFAPDRGVTRAFIGRASYTIDPNRTVAFETAVRSRMNGAYAKVEYSEASGQHWRATLTATLIQGGADDFLGQYRRNSHVALALRYSF